MSDNKSLSFQQMRNRMNLSADRDPEAAAIQNAPIPTVSEAPLPQQKASVPPEEIPTHEEPVVPIAPPTPKTKSAKSRKNNDTTADVKMVNRGIHVDPNAYKSLQFICLENNVPLSKFLRDVMYALLRSTYRCTNPACHCKFTMRHTEDGEPSTAHTCPVCGGKITKVKY